MAFSKTPATSTYQTKFIPFVFKWDQRGNTEFSTYDSRIVNAIPEIVQDDVNGSYFNAYKRDGSTHVKRRNATPPQPEFDDFGAVITGLHNNSPARECLVLTTSGPTTTVWVGTTPIFPGSDYLLDIQATLTSPLTVPDTIQPTFTDFVYDNGDIVTIYGIEGNGLLVRVKQESAWAISSVATSAFNGDPVTLDGYVFASDSDGNIWNSNLNDPMTWNPSNFITAESYGDKLVRIARAGSYIVAFGTNSIEWFYDAANPTGSPLSVYPGATRRVGYLGGLAYNGDVLYFIGREEDGAVSLYRISGLKLEKVTDFLASREFTNFFTSTTAKGNFITLNGHTLYVISGEVPDPQTSKTIYYDLDSKAFGQLGFQDSDVFQIRQVATYKLNGRFNDEYVNMFCITGLAGDPRRVYAYSPWFSQDDGVNYTVTLRTENQDFDSRRNKFGARALIHCDRPLGATLASNGTLKWSVDDYRTVPNSVDVNLNDEFPCVHALGQFRRIAFQVEYTDAYPIRFNGIEFDYQIGGS